MKITVNPANHKIYFSISLIQNYQMKGRFFRLEASGNGALLVVSDERADDSFKITEYKAAYYTKSKVLHHSLCAALGRKVNERFTISGLPSASLNMVRLSIHKTLNKRSLCRMRTEVSRPVTEVDQQRAREEWSEYLRTDFPGRIKTRATVMLEKWITRPQNARSLA